ncbi:MAG: response regulator transcription factor [Bacteroidetes bacterium]|nr:response regulator transcription factor [Bacteroidota bacterium]
MKILLVEDEAAVATMISRGLKESGYSVTVAPDGQTGWDMISTHDFDIVILDIMLPGINGLELCRKMRRESIATPVLMLTALGTTENIVTGLDGGADDYLTKPFKFAELEARLRTLLRRTANTTTTPKDYLQVSDLVINSAAKAVTRKGRAISLTSTEYRLLEYMVRNRGRVLSRMEMLEHVWSIDFNMSTNVVDVYVNYLRKKIDKQSDQKLIQTVVGMGYIINDH